MFEIKIITPTKKETVFQASILNVRTTNGQIGLLTNHMPYLANVVESDMNFVDENQQRQFFHIGKGILYFDNNQATLLIDFFEPTNKSE